MKKQFISNALCATVVSLFLFSCSSSDETLNGNNEEQSSIESLLTTNSEQVVDFEINYEVVSGNRVTFDVYSENPYALNSEAPVKPFMSAMTDDNGEYKFSRMIPGGIKEVYVVASCDGVPSLLHGEIVNGVVKPEAVADSRAGYGFGNTNCGPSNNCVVNDYSRAVRPLKDIIDDIEDDEVLKNMLIYTKSSFRIVNGKVTGVNDEVYVGSVCNIGKVILADFKFTIHSFLNNIFVYDRSVFSRAKAKGLVHTTVKEMGVEIQKSRSAVNVTKGMSPSEVIKNIILQNKEDLKNGLYLKLDMYVEFEPVNYFEFITTIPLPPYTPFIEND